MLRFVTFRIIQLGRYHGFAQGVYGYPDFVVIKQMLIGQSGAKIMKMLLNKIDRFINKGFRQAIIGREAFQAVYDPAVALFANAGAKPAYLPLGKGKDIRSLRPG
jgi:hypothetical protein